MRPHYLNIVKNIDLFQEIDDDILEIMLASFSLVEIKENEILFQQNDTADALYITLSGYLLAMLKNDKGEWESIGRIKTGELIGEMGLLTKKPRSITVKALSDSKLLKLTQTEFTRLIKLAPDVVYQILLNIIMRGQKQLNTMSLISQQVIKKTNRHILIAPANHHANLTVFFKELKEIISTHHQHCFFLEEEKLLFHYDTRGLSGLMEYIDSMEKFHHTLVYKITPPTEKLIKFILKRTDILAIVATGNHLPDYSPFICQILEQSDAKNIQKELILVWPPQSEIKNTHLWLYQLSDFHLHHHVREKEMSSYERLLRFFQGKAIGLVLGGGAARGWAHLGVIQALKEKNIPVDAICGTSSGAGVAGFYLVSETQDDLTYCVKQMRDGVNHSTAWFSLTLPMISFYNAARVTRNLEAIFNEKMIENAPIPYFSISANVNAQSEVIHRSGKIWRAIRASAAIPGFFPPLVENGQLLYDGGLVNNLPVDQMRALLGPHGIIIASDLGVSLADSRQYYFPPILSTAQILLSKFGFTRKKYIFPNFLGALLKAMLMGSLQKYEDNILLANYYIHPNLEKYNTLSLEEISEKELVKSGYQNALAILKDWH